MAPRLTVPPSRRSRSRIKARRLCDEAERKLKPGLRPIDSAPGRVVSPADGTVVESGRAVAGQLLQAKGSLFDLAALLDDADAAARLEGGAYLITYLSPKDYHRVHSPVAGRVIGWQHVPGTLFSVGSASIRREPGLFVRNERFITMIEMDGGGLAAVVMVAAVGVGHVTVSYDPDVATHNPQFLRAAVRRQSYEQPKAIGRGEELGIFHLGSTTIVEFEPGRVALDPVVSGASRKMGGGIGHIEAVRGNSQGSGRVEGPPRRLTAHVKRPIAYARGRRWQGTRWGGAATCSRRRPA